MIKIVKFEKEDFSRLISWIDSEKLLIQFAGPIFSYPLTFPQLDEYVSDPNKRIFKALDPISNVVFGHAEIFIDNKNAKLCRILIGDQSYKGKGYGQQIVNNLLDVCFLDLSVERVELNVFDWNSSAIRCYESVGFKINKGVTTITNFHGIEWISINMIISKAEWAGNN